MKIIQSKTKKIIQIVLITIMISIIPLTAFAESDTTSYRDMALASCLSYVAVPHKSNEDGSIKGEVRFSDNLEVIKYFNEFTNLYNYASSDEMDDWLFVDYENKNTGKTGLFKVFTAYTLKKGNDIMIVYRGTDFIDLFEWIQHLSYGLTNVHAQESYAEEYALKIAKRYNEGQNIYLTGHSLGGYLAQIGGAAISKAVENANNNTTDWDGFNLSKNYKYDINDFLVDGTFSAFKNVKIEQIVGFNGIGINFLSYIGDKTLTQAAKIEQLKKIAEQKATDGSSRLINYFTYGDPVSSLGVHYGEIRELKAAIDSLTFMRDSFKPLGTLNSALTNAKTSKFLNYIKKLDLDKTDDTYLNIFKKDVFRAYDDYQINSVVAFVVMVHKPDNFASILENDKQIENTRNAGVKVQNPTIKVTENLIEKTSITTYNPVTLKASVKYSGVQKYEWYECTKNGKIIGKPIETSEVIKGIDPDNANVPDNKFEITKNNKGTTKYYKVRAYCADAYTSGNYTKTNGLYGYEFDEEMTEHVCRILESKVIKVEYKQTIISKILSLFKRR